MKYARLKNKVVVELFNTLPDFHADFIAQLVDVDDAVICGMIRTETGFKHPEFIEKTPPEKATDQYVAIDSHIATKIKTLDYDSVSQVALCCVVGNIYQVEALRVQAWIIECWEIQDKINKGVLIFESVDDALLSLPPFEIL